jgi:hypothetical protein
MHASGQKPKLGVSLVSDCLTRVAVTPDPERVLTTRS